MTNYLLLLHRQKVAKKQHQQGIILIATLAILASIASLFYNSINYINIEQQVLANTISQQQYRASIQRELKILFEQLTIQQFDIINNLNNQQSITMESTNLNIQLSATKLTESQLVVSGTLFQQNQSILLNLNYDIDSARWTLISSTWSQTD